MTNTRKEREAEFARLLAKCEPWQLKIIYNYTVLLKEDETKANAYAAQVMQELEEERNKKEEHHAKQNNVCTAAGNS